MEVVAVVENGEVDPRPVVQRLEPTWNRAHYAICFIAASASPPTSLPCASLLVHGGRVGRRRDAPLLLFVDDEAALHPVLGRVLRDLAEAIIALGDGHDPGRLQDALERHGVVRLPFVIEHLALKKGLIIDVTDAVALLQGKQRFLRSVESDELGTVGLGDRLVVPGASGRADRLTLQLRPILDAGLLQKDDVDEIGVVRRVDCLHHAAALRLVRDRRDQHVDLALLQELHAVGGNHRHELKLDAEPLGDVGGEVGLDAHQGSARVTVGERAVIRLDSDDQRPACLDRVGRIERLGSCGPCRCGQDESEQANFHAVHFLLLRRSQAKYTPIRPRRRTGIERMARDRCCCARPSAVRRRPCRSRPSA